MANYWVPEYLKDMGAWINNPNTPMYGRWNHASDNEGGVDLTSPGGTPVYALADGDIVGSGYFCHPGTASHGTFNLSNNGCPILGQTPGYGVVTTRCSIPGYGMNDLYYQHIDIDASVPLFPDGTTNGGSIKRGQRIGTIRANVGELEMGLNANWGTIWGSNHPNTWSNDPRPAIKALMALGDPGTVASGITLPGGNNAVEQLGEWVAVNIFKSDPTVVTATASVSSIPFLAIGIVVLGLAGVLLFVLFVALIGM